MTPRTRADIIRDDVTAVCCWIVLFLAAAIVLLQLLPRPAPTSRAASAERLFASPKIGLRAAALGCAAPATEARR